MAAGGPYFYLREDERPLQRLAAAPAFAVVLFVPLLVVLSIPLGAAVVARLLVPRFDAVPWAAILGVYAGLLVVAGLFAWRRAATTEYALTDERIYARVGRFVTRLHFTTHDKVTDIRYRQGPLERAFGLASLTFATAGGEVTVAGVRDALAVKAAAERARDAFVRQLLKDVPAHGPSEAAPGEAAHAPRPAPVAVEAPPWTGPRPGYLQSGDTPVWFARPRPIAAVGALRSVIGILAVLLFSNFLRGEMRVWVPLAAVGIILMFVAFRLAQLRRMEYVATERRVYARAGLVGTTVNQLTYDKITDITLTQDVLGRIFGYGSVVVQTAGSQQAPITMVGLGDPLAAKETIERWRDLSLGAAR